MTKLSKKALADFKKRYLEVRGIELSDSEADEMGWKLLQLASMTLKSDQNSQPP